MLKTLRRHHLDDLVRFMLMGKERFKVYNSKRHGSSTQIRVWRFILCSMIQTSLLRSSTDLTPFVIVVLSRAKIFATMGLIGV